MNGAIVRIEQVEIRNFKNVVHGIIGFKNTHKSYKASVLGLYGQNGSGKTALIDVIDILKYVFIVRQMMRKVQINDPGVLAFILMQTMHKYSIN